MGTPLGSVRVLRSGEDDVLLPLARVEVHGARYDREQHRAPFGVLWFTSGTGKQRPQEVELRLRVESGGMLSSAASATRAVVALLRSADSIETPIVHLLEPRVLSYSASPAPGGAYWLTVRVSAIHTLPAQPFTVVFAESTVLFDARTVRFDT